MIDYNIWTFDLFYVTTVLISVYLTVNLKYKNLSKEVLTRMINILGFENFKFQEFSRYLKAR